MKINDTKLREVIERLWVIELLIINFLFHFKFKE